VDTNYLYHHNNTNSPTLEKMTLSPCVVQITMDYLYVRTQLLDDGVEVQTEMGQDIALSIVCDAYTREASQRGIRIMRMSDGVSDGCNNA